MVLIDISAGSFNFVSRLEQSKAPKTSTLFLSLNPYQNSLIHARWSGEGCWIPMGDTRFDLPFENHTCSPAPGQIIFYPGGISEAEILLAYGEVRFASKYGRLAGNHFLTVIEGTEYLAELGKHTLRSGAQPIKFVPRQS